MAACYGAGALSSLLLARWSGRLGLAVGHLAALAGAVAGVGISLGVLLGEPGRTLTQPLPVLFPFARLSLSVDGLSAYFLFVISLGRRGSHLRSGVSSGAFTRCRIGATGGAGSRVERVPGLHGVPVLR